MSLTFLELKDIAERNIELINPTSPEKLLKIGRLAGMSSGKRLIDFGCGYAEPLTLWGKHFDISGVGIDVRPKAIERARAKIADLGLSDRLEVIEGKGADHPFAPGSFDIAACIGASFVWGGVKDALPELKRAIHSDGKIILGEPYWLKDAIPPDFAQQQNEIQSEIALLRLFRQAGLEVEYVLHSNHDEWDEYEAGNLYGLSRWIEENPDHPDLPQVVQYLHESQEEYFQYGREYFGWALYLLSRIMHKS
jgi:ubiquinone/menaquinone biosynthesis C-methylase UbiE